MVAVTVGEISPVPAGIIYCAVIETCHLAFDLHRAHEWTRALDRWCDAQQKLVAFSGQCQMHRAELYRLHGAWTEAIDAAKMAQDLAFRGDRMATYGGFYEQGEIHRFRGDFDAAEAPAARAATEELASLCTSIDMPLLHALAEQSEAALLFHDGDAAAALVPLRRAWSRWLGLDAPFEAARCRALLARLCAALGDEESARLEREAARAVFSELGAAPALAGPEQRPPVAPDARTAPDRTAPAPTAPAPTTGSDARHAADAGPLTARETEVVRLVSAGLSNRKIAAELFISEKTVARHLSNIFTKLGLTSRAAVTAYAYQHGLA